MYYWLSQILIAFLGLQRCFELVRAYSVFPSGDRRRRLAEQLDDSLAKRGYAVCEGCGWTMIKDWDLKECYSCMG